MDKKQKTSIVLVVMGFFYVGLQVIPYPHQNKQTLFHQQNGTPLVIAHGGAKTLYPENTIYAFEEVEKMGVDVLEVDLCLSKDGVLVTHHNQSIDDTSDGQGWVYSYTYEQLSAFHFGYDFQDANKKYSYREAEEPIRSKLIPMRLEDLFVRFPDMRFILELKDEGDLGKQAVKEVYTLIEKYQKQQQVCVASFHQEVLDYFSSINKNETVTTLGYTEAKRFVVSNLWGYGLFTMPNTEGLLLPKEERGIALLNKYLVYKIHHQGMFVYYWTINDKKTMQQLIDLGVDGIISDRPDLVKEVLQENRDK